MPLNFLDKLNNKIGLGLAALGRPEYININHNQELGLDKKDLISFFRKLKNDIIKKLYK